MGYKEFDIPRDVNDWKNVFGLTEPGDNRCPFCGSHEATFEGNRWRKEPKGYIFTCRKCGKAYVQKKRFLLPELGK